MKTPWQVACEWYSAEQVYQSIFYGPGKIPKDVNSREFAEWLTEQYRLAMTKGIQLGRDGVAQTRQDSEKKSSDDS